MKNQLSRHAICHGAFVGRAAAVGATLFLSPPGPLLRGAPADAPGSTPASIECQVHPAVPPALTNQAAGRAVRGERTVELSNGYLSAEIDLRTAVIIRVQNRLTGETYPIDGDRIGFAGAAATGGSVSWEARAGRAQAFAVAVQEPPDGSSRATFSLGADGSRPGVEIKYTLARGQFWVERRLEVGAGAMRYDQLTYGAAEIAGGTVNQLKLGKFDAPRLISSGAGGVFAGVGWWFYEVYAGVYQNTRMNHEAAGPFTAEPWYLGVFQGEPGEPYPGWLWYKTFLSERKLAHDRHLSYALWNARSGYDFRPISDPNILDFVGTAKAIGLNGVTTGEVRGVGPESERAATDRTARRVVDAFRGAGIDFGLHEGAVDAAKWRSEAALAAKRREVDRAWEQGIRQLSVDFFRVGDSFGEHRRAAEFFRHIRERMNYTECHLGMAAYGPQFQREVLINHPTDLHGFEISRFSSDWATLVGFRHSRREWQRRYAYLMPENGLFYFCTHYSNFPRRYAEPEPQQFLFRAHAWRGLAYAFHDRIGYRDAVAAQAAFSTFYVFGYLDDQMPAADLAFTRDYLAWVKANASVLNRGRVAMESEHALVMSKVRDGRGAIFAINYTPGVKRFRMRLELPGSNGIFVRQVYPDRAPTIRLATGDELDATIPGERLAIFEVNQGLQGLPPQNPSAFPVDITGWLRNGNDFLATAVVPDVRANLARQRNATLPERVVSADQTETEAVLAKSAGKGQGRLPGEFLAAYGFVDEKFLPTWKAAPWAFGDRVWLVYVPTEPPTLVERVPRLRINGREVPFVPRVQYDPAGKVASKWTVPMWFADVTGVCRYGGNNEIVLSGIKEHTPGPCFITSSGWAEP